MTEDKHKLEQYLESVREVERRIENEARQIGAGQNISEAAARQLAKLNIGGLAPRWGETKRA